jgi:hypothetical protein
MSKFFPKWLSPRAFIVAAFIAGIQGAKTIETYGFGTEAVVSAIVETLVGGIFWGWVLTKFVPKYFGTKNEESI